MTTTTCKRFVYSPRANANDPEWMREGDEHRMCAGDASGITWSSCNTRTAQGFAR